jgi:hypothetical protein
MTRGEAGGIDSSELMTRQQRFRIYGAESLNPRWKMTAQKRSRIFKAESPNPRRAKYKKNNG